jgi:nicotinate-nucleotide adenylyltransferase
VSVAHRRPAPGVGLFGGAFDPPHDGHVALVGAAERELEPERIVVLVVADPGHKRVEASAAARLELARLAFPRHEVELDQYPRTIDSLRAGRWLDPVLLIGADEFADLLSWKEPDALLELATLAVATRPGYPRRQLDAVLGALKRPERVSFFEIAPHPVSSAEIRDRVRRGESIAGLVPGAVAEAVQSMDLYRR